MPRSGLLLSRAVPRMVLPASALHLGHKTELRVFPPSGCYLRTDGVTVTHSCITKGCWALQAVDLCPAARGCSCGTVGIVVPSLCRLRRNGFLWKFCFV